MGIDGYGRRIWTALTERVGALFASRRFETELNEEIRFHLERATERNIERGMEPDEARRRALRDFGGSGGVERAKEQVRSETGVRLVFDVIRDVRYALRNLRRQATFTAVVVVTIAVTVGTNASVFSLVHSVLLRPLPFPESDKLVQVFNRYPEAGVDRSENSPPDYYDRRDNVRALEEVALYAEEGRTLGGEDGGRRAFALTVTPSFFQVLRASPAIGRLFQAGDETAAEGREVVIGHTLWQTAFNGSADVVGTTALFDGSPHTIVGVLPESFRFSTWDAQVFVPLYFSPEDRSDDRRHTGGFQMIGRLGSGSTVQTAQAEIDALNRFILESYPAELAATVTEAGYHTVVRPYLADMTRDVRTPFLLMWAGVLLVLVIGAANVTSLFLLRGRARFRELAARMALGASRLRIVRQLVTESTVIVAVGGGLGLVLAGWSLGLLDAFEVYDIPRVDEVSINGVVVAVSFGVVLLLGAIAGAAPAFALIRQGGGDLLSGDRGGIGRGASRLHRALVSGQIALAFVLVMGAGLLVDTVRNLMAVDPGFDSDRVEVGAIGLPGPRYSDPSTRRQFVDQFLDAARTVPGVVSIGTASQLPFSEVESRGAFVAEGSERPAGEAIDIPYQTIVSPDYFHTMGIDVTSGRGFTRADDATAFRVAVIDETLAQRHWRNTDPIGRRLWLGADRGSAETAYTIVGVVETIKQNTLTETQPPGAIYLSAHQMPPYFFRVAGKLEGDPAAAWAGVGEQLHALDPGLVLFWHDTMEGSVRGSLILQRTPMQLISAFAVIGLFLGVLGVYGVMAYTVAKRRREIGLRMAIGSTSRQIVSLVGREWIGVVGIGVTFGLAATLLSTRILESLLYGTGTLDPLVLVSTLGIIVLTALISCYLPVRRAVSVDPAGVLKAE